MVERYHKVTGNTPSRIKEFLEMGQDYMSDTPKEKRDMFLQSMVDLQRQPYRWLLLYEVDSEPLGFAHIRYGGDRPSWGWILEFYIKPEMRRKGYGTKLYNRCERILSNEGASSYWLTTNPEASTFWRSLGYRKTGVIADYNDYEVMEKLSPKTDAKVQPKKEGG